MKYRHLILKQILQYKIGNILGHGLISSKSCFNVWNRDVNGVTNIYRIAKMQLMDKKDKNIQQGKEG